ncbi:hypothetical protein P3S68_014917 [Capsicum galapagoense]
MTTSFSFSSFDSKLVLCLIVASLMIPSTSNPLAKVCIRSKNPKFCLQVLDQYTYSSPYELTQEAINLALTSAYETTDKIHTFLDQTKNHDLEVIYNKCLHYYQTAIDVLNGANDQFLKDRLYSAVKFAGKRAQEDAFLCEHAFQSIAGYVYDSTLTKDNENLGIFGSIVMSAVDLLYNSTSVKNSM